RTLASVGLQRVKVDDREGRKSEAIFDREVTVGRACHSSYRYRKAGQIAAVQRHRVGGVPHVAEIVEPVAYADLRNAGFQLGDRLVQAADPVHSGLVALHQIEAVAEPLDGRPELGVGRAVGSTLEDDVDIYPLDGGLGEPVESMRQ